MNYDINFIIIVSLVSVLLTTRVNTPPLIFLFYIVPTFNVVLMWLFRDSRRTIYYYRILFCAGLYVGQRKSN